MKHIGYTIAGAGMMGVAIAIGVAFNKFIVAPLTDGWLDYLFTKYDASIAFYLSPLPCLLPLIVIVCYCLGAFVFRKAAEVLKA